VRTVGALRAGVGGAALLALIALGVLPAAAQIVGPPEISNVSASGVTGRRATLSATIEPRGAPTAYEVFVRYSPCPGGAGECAMPPRQERIGHGKISPTVNARTVRPKLVMLTAGCTYEYWFVASNSFGTVESERQSVTSVAGSRQPRACKR
jgi:hypothetical protein